MIILLSTPVALLWGWGVEKDVVSYFLVKCGFKDDLV